MSYFSKIYTTNVLQFARFFLAFSLFLTLICTPFKDLFPEFHIVKLKDNLRELSSLNYYLWFTNIKIPYVITLFILTLVILGVYPRFLSILHWWATYSTFYTMFIIEGGDQISVIITLLLVPICILDKRSFGWIKLSNPPCINKYLLYFSYTTFIVIQIQLCMLYLNAGVAKLSVAEWVDGTAIYYWFNNNIFGAPEYIRFLLGSLFTNGITVSLIDWSVIILEIMLFVSFFLEQKFKYILFFLAFIFHFLIFLIHGLGTFWISMTGCLILFCFNPTISFEQNIDEMKKIFSYYKNHFVSILKI
ncbi:antimicrobial peptide system SdpB family protein [Chryseobacterium rhizosphaerae]|uniref:hypothetical protein n=1 Tax=Chryseobacterium rhizosphaerae TaxID=395937 RepID=UPI00286549BE|nr:hypothetical protein [Chryseobacterium rhizosphaerae]MDR6544088.1 antimicrobial peptide system SdpB family protein [Chryseobacterium rhizosphaerae]